jgi:hypothetical protein
MTCAAYDYYPTPAWCVRRLLEAVDLPGGWWMEPAVGDGAIVRAVNAARDDVRWTTMDIRPECDPDLVGDFVAPLFRACFETSDIFDVCITNPPYNQAAEFVVKARRRARVVAMLLRLNWLASRERRDLLASAMPDVYVLPDRPSFTGGGSDMTEYAWLIWRGDRAPGQPGEVRILATTPVAERRIHHADLG